MWDWYQWAYFWSSALSNIVQWLFQYENADLVS